MSQCKEEKLDVWKDVLGAPRYIVAPMVNASELAWRLLSRRHGAHLCYTPMLHSSVFCRDPKYRKAALASTPEDRPLIVQFCGNDPATLLEAALLAEPHCDAIDINIGCPQSIAKRGCYGAFLQDEWDLLKKIVNTLSKNIRVPVTCKLRVFPEIEKTVEYARMLEAAGASLLAVHGRTREQKGPLTGLASWKHIKAVREAVKIPVFSNGNIQCLQDADRCLEETLVNGVMAAEANLYNPFIFEGCNPPCWEPAMEYLEIVDRHPVPFSCVRGHLFKLFFQLLCLPENLEERMCLATQSTIKSFKSIVEKLRDRYLPYHEGKVIWEPKNEDSNYNLHLPPWICQSYTRYVSHLHTEKVQAKREDSNTVMEITTEADGYMTRKRMKKIEKESRRLERAGSSVKRGTKLCNTCPNPLGSKCVFELCRQCCRRKCYEENLDCVGHRNLTKTRRQMAQEFAKSQNENKNDNMTTNLL